MAEAVTEVKVTDQSQDVDKAICVVQAEPEEPAAPVCAPMSPPLSLPISHGEFHAIYEAQFDYVFHSLRRLGVPEGDIEDLAHDVFVVLYRGRADYDRARPIKPWLFGIAFRVASDFRRRARHRFEVPSDDREFADGAPGAEERLAIADERALVREALGTLDLDRRAVFVMHELDGHAMPEIAAALGVPLNTAYSRLRLAREQFTLVVRRKRLQRETP